MWKSEKIMNTAKNFCTNGKKSVQLKDEFLKLKKMRKTKGLLLVGSIVLLMLSSCTFNVNFDDASGYIKKPEVVATTPQTTAQINAKNFELYQDIQTCAPSDTAVASSNKESRFVGDRSSWIRRKTRFFTGQSKYLDYPVKTQTQVSDDAQNSQSAADQEKSLEVSYAAFLDKKDVADFASRLTKNVEKMDAPILTTPEIYERIWNRTFSIVTLHICLKDDRSPLIVGSGGTAWLLDYAYNAKEDKYKLFFATNAHVAQDIEDKKVFDPANYKYGNPKQSAKKYFYFLGRTENPSFTFKNQHAKQSTAFYYGTTEKDYNMLNRFTKLKEAKLYGLWSKVIKKPEVFYVAVDFMKEDSTKQFQDLWKQHYSILSYKHLSNTGKPLKETKKVRHYKDFAVVEYEVDMRMVNEAEQKLQADPFAKSEILQFKKWISQAIDEVARTKENSSNFNFTNKNNFSNEWWDFADNLGVTGYRNSLTEIGRKKVSRTTEKFYHGGYPASNIVSKTGEDLEDYGMQWRHSEQNLIDGDVTYRSDNNSYVFLQPFYKALWFLDYKGQHLHSFGYTNYGMSGTDGGASGSLVTNEEGLPVSILWGGRSFLDLGSWTWETDKVFIFDSLSQSSKIIEKKIEIVQTDAGLKYKVTPEYVHHAYNLIDGTDKSRYPMQLTSFRGALNAKYPNGVFGDGNTATALFKNYLVEKQAEEERKKVEKMNEIEEE